MDGTLIDNPGGAGGPNETSFGKVRPKMQFTYKLERAQKELGELARKHFGKAEIVAELPDVVPGDESATVSRLIDAAGSVGNLRNTFVAQARLARQKAVKDAADDVAKRVEAGEITRDAGLTLLTDILNRPAIVTIRGEGETKRKASPKVKEAAKAEAKSEMAASALKNLEGLSGKALAGAIQILEGMGIEVPSEYKNR